ncbi:MAG: class II D-tagatose-bisphosphate aldolase, non-catalytic subunit [Cypionkella sp.]|uniref:class II D-tagatose-bisphosphate aldolase, non-catalytic subunit n=1 Tax=Cypionkella sp. TaxID=2811411 RepID=UPI002ABCDA86|nr:class II D-tagatose-bisphosphate aldolase, non-catalytic subunit [Cypionkella sp.]MDZ4309592.1 class II D-tagatose-bisphosphate aldolase, non-catalytic subunit [Cypionkella sp.]
MSTAALLAFAPARKSGQVLAIPSICSAHPVVIAASFAMARARGTPVLIEATCNQVNHEGGYTGMTPADFRGFVLDIAAAERFDPAGLILGGDHLGPNPWTALPAAQAMAKACDMVAAYALAGFGKIHLDASMSCADDPTPLPDATIATRNAQLAAVAEAHSPTPPVYIIGTEVPVPGGAWEEVEGLTPTSPQAALATVALQRAAFKAAGIEAAFARVVGLVVQPGVEFGNENVVAYNRPAARDLVACLPDLPMLFEAHSTDYQTPQALADLVQDGFGILKVGPGLTFALREALYGLDHIADVLFPDHTPLRGAMEALMLQKPQHWAKYYPGTPLHQHLQRHYSYSDRIRYYWTDPIASAAVADLMDRFGDKNIPEPLISQHLGATYGEVMTGQTAKTAPALLRAAVMRALTPYFDACYPAH